MARHPTTRHPAGRHGERLSRLGAFTGNIVRIIRHDDAVVSMKMPDGRLLAAEELPAAARCRRTSSRLEQSPPDARPVNNAPRSPVRLPKINQNAPICILFHS